MQWVDLWRAGLETQRTLARWRERWETPDALFASVEGRSASIRGMLDASDGVIRGADLDRDWVRVRGRPLDRSQIEERLRRVDRSLERRGFSAVTYRAAEDLPVLVRTATRSAWVVLAGDASLLDQRGIAIVGSRRIDGDEREVVRRVVHAIIDTFPEPLVSGGALGVDAVVHDVALERGRSMVLHLAGGLARCGPTRHREAFARVAREGGLVVTDRPPLEAPQRYEFVRRNQRIAASSIAVVVLYAGATSGALATATHALQRGVPVLAMPGRPSDPLALGCIELLRCGARVFGGMDDLVEALARAAPPVTDARARLPLRRAAEESSTVVTSRCMVNVTPVPDDVIARWSGMVDRVIARLDEGGRSGIAPHTDDLVRACGGSTAHVQCLLFELELAGCIIPHATGGWVRR
jgi:DNA protecting protein DprA